MFRLGEKVFKVKRYSESATVYLALSARTRTWDSVVVPACLSSLKLPCVSSDADGHTAFILDLSCLSLHRLDHNFSIRGSTTMIRLPKKHAPVGCIANSKDRYVVLLFSEDNRAFLVTDGGGSYLKVRCTEELGSTPKPKTLPGHPTSACIALIHEIPVGCIVTDADTLIFVSINDTSRCLSLNRVLRLEDDALVHHFSMDNSIVVILRTRKAVFSAPKHVFSFTDACRCNTDSRRLSQGPTGKYGMRALIYRHSEDITIELVSLPSAFASPMLYDVSTRSLVSDTGERLRSSVLTFLARDSPVAGILRDLSMQHNNENSDPLVTYPKCRRSSTLESQMNPVELSDVRAYVPSDFAFDYLWLASTLGNIAKEHSPRQQHPSAKSTPRSSLPPRISPKDLLDPSSARKQSEGLHYRQRSNEFVVKDSSRLADAQTNTDTVLPDTASGNEPLSSCDVCCGADEGDQSVDSSPNTSGGATLTKLLRNVLPEQFKNLESRLLLSTERQSNALRTQISSALAHTHERISAMLQPLAARLDRLEDIISSHIIDPGVGSRDIAEDQSLGQGIHHEQKYVHRCSAFSTNKSPRAEKDTVTISSASTETRNMVAAFNDASRPSGQASQKNRIGKHSCFSDPIQRSGKSTVLRFEHDNNRLTEDDSTAGHTHSSSRLSPDSMRHAPPFDLPAARPSGIRLPELKIDVSIIGTSQTVRQSGLLKSHSDGYLLKPFAALHNCSSGLRASCDALALPSSILDYEPFHAPADVRADQYAATPTAIQN